MIIVARFLVFTSAVKNIYDAINNIGICWRDICRRIPRIQEHVSKKTDPKNAEASYDEQPNNPLQELQSGHHAASMINYG